MFFIPGALITLITFPGVIIHELAHFLMCKWTGTRVLEVCYFRRGNPAGYVIHERPRQAWKSVLIGLGPFFVNSVLGAFIAFPVMLKLVDFDADLTPLEMFLIWMGVSIAMHALPSRGDADAMWSAVSGESAGLLARIFVAPLVGLIYLMSIASVFWFDVIYGAGISMALPKLAVWLAA